MFYFLIFLLPFFLIVKSIDSHVVKKRFAWNELSNLYWAENCDWTENNLSNVKTPGDQCGGKCVNTAECTHFTWTQYNGGTCWLKKNAVSLDQAITSNGYAVCGKVKTSSPPASDPPAKGKTGECPDGWSMVKKFDLSNMDKIRNDWNIKTFPVGFVNNEKQKYTTDERNIFSRDGHLIVKAFRDGDSFTSGRLESKQQFSPFDVPSKKLRVEFTGKVPTSMGAWPAYWMLGIDSTYGTWPTSGEIDVMEWVYSISRSYKASLHWSGSGSLKSISRDFELSAADMSKNFITYGVEYSAVPNDEYIKFYMRRENGAFVSVQKFDKNTWSSFNCPQGKEPGRFPCSTLAPFDNKMYLIINLAVGGDWGGVGVTDYNAFNGGVEFETSDVTVCKKL